MNLTHADPRSSISSIDSIRAFIAGVVVTAAHNRGPKVQLTYVGGEFTKAVGLPFERHLNDLAEQNVLSIPKPRRKLATFIDCYCRDLIGMERSDAGTWLVFPAEHVEGTDGSVPHPGSQPMLRFKAAVWAAFIRPIAATHRFLNLEQIGFTDVDQKPAEGNWREIDRQFVLGVAPDEQVDGATVQGQIEAWAAASGVPISSLVVTATKGQEASRPLRQLLDLIDSLPPEVAASWSIPAAVLKHLSRAR